MRTLRVLAVLTIAGLPTGARAMPNPASTFCEAMGGRLVLAKSSHGGEVGLCHLPGDRIVEEWTLFRMLDGKVPSPDKNPFR